MPWITSPVCDNRGVSHPRDQGACAPGRRAATRRAGGGAAARGEPMPFEGPLPRFDVSADFWSLRFVHETCDSYAVRKNVPLPFAVSTNAGAMASVYVDGGYGYAATADLSSAGLRDALERAARWAHVTARHALIDARTLPRPRPRGDYVSPGFDAPLPTRHEWYDMLLAESREAAIDARIVDWEALVDVVTATHRFVTSEGGDV